MLDERQELFLELIFLPEYANNMKQAALDAGYAETYSVNAILATEEMSKAIVQRLDKSLLATAVQCVPKIQTVLNTPDMKGAKALLEAVSMVLDRTGLSKRERIEIEHKTVPLIFEIPAKRDD